MYQQQFNSRLISAITLKKKINQSLFLTWLCVCVGQCMAAYTCHLSEWNCNRHKCHAVPSVRTKAFTGHWHGSGQNWTDPILIKWGSLRAITVTKMLPCDWQILYQSFCLCVCVCLNVGIFLCVCVLFFDWVLTCVWIAQFFFLSNKVLIEPSLRHRFITEDNFHHIIWCQGAADLSRVVDPDKSSPSRELSCFWSPQSFHQLSRNRLCPSLVYDVLRVASVTPI